jgi:hypothetical protein
MQGIQAELGKLRKMRDKISACVTICLREKYPYRPINVTSVMHKQRCTEKRFPAWKSKLHTGDVKIELNRH